MTSDGQQRYCARVILLIQPACASLARASSLACKLRQVLLSDHPPKPGARCIVRELVNAAIVNDRAGSRCFGDSLVHSPSAAAPPRSQTPVTLADANVTAARGGLADSRETNKQPQLPKQAQYFSLMKGRDIWRITLLHLYYCTGWLLTESRQNVNQCIGEYGEHIYRNKVACQIALTSIHIFFK